MTPNHQNNLIIRFLVPENPYFDLLHAYIKKQKINYTKIGVSRDPKKGVVASYRPYISSNR